MLLGACLALLCSAFTASAQEPAIPLSFEPRERLAKPDLAALPRLRFLTTADLPSFNSTNGDGQLAGFNIDLARAVCLELGIAAKCEIQALPWDDLQGALARGEGEAIIAGIAISQASRANLVFSRPYLTFPGRFVMPKARRAAEPLWQALRGEKVGVIANTAHERFLRASFGGVTVTPFPDARHLLEALAAGRIAAAFGDGMRLSQWLNDGTGADCCGFAGGPYLAPDYFGSGLAIAVRPDETFLAAALDYALRAITAKNTFAELYLRWFPIGFF